MGPLVLCLYSCLFGYPLCVIAYASYSMRNSMEALMDLLRLGAILTAFLGSSLGSPFSIFLLLRQFLLTKGSEELCKMDCMVSAILLISSSFSSSLHSSRFLKMFSSWSCLIWSSENLKLSLNCSSSTTLSARSLSMEHLRLFICSI